MTVKVGDVAARAGVSPGTVSNVLNRPEVVSDKIIVRVRSAIADLGYIPNHAARQLRVGKSNTVACLVRDVRNPFFTDVAMGADDRALASGLNLTMANSDESVARQATYLDLFEQQRVHSVLISPIGEVTERLVRMRDRGVSVVLLDSTLETFSSVSVNNVLGGRIAADHLLERGRRRIAFVGRAQSISQDRDRLDGLCSSIQRSSAAVRLTAIETSEHSVAAGNTAAMQILGLAPADRPDAVFAANDMLAIGILQTLMSRPEVRVPEDIAVLGYDDIQFAQSTSVPLSSIAQPSVLIGTYAMEIAVAESASPRLALRQIKLTPRLIVRAST